jgi:hypothetical protein
MGYCIASLYYSTTHCTCDVIDVSLTIQNLVSKKTENSLF